MDIIKESLHGMSATWENTYLPGKKNQMEISNG